MASASPVSQTSALLSIPTEIRLRIYHYLFKNEPDEECFLSGAHYGPWLERHKTQRPKVETSIDRQDVTSKGRHPEILRVNHQIYFEAFPVLYSRLETVDPSKGTRRYKPLEGETQAYSLGNHREDESFDVVFDPPLMLYPTKPPKSARFNKVLFHAEFVVSDMLPDWRYDEENGKLDYALQEEFTDALRTTSMIKNFVELLAGCSWVDHVDLDFGLVAGWDTDQQRRGLPNHDPGEAHWNRLKKLWRKGDILVANIFLASGVLDPLQRLRNVRSWCIGLTVEDLEEEPPSTHERMTLDLSNAIKQTRTELCSGHDSNVAPCGLLWKPIEPLLDPLLYQT